MIVVDSSALVAILRREPEADKFLQAIATAEGCLLSSVSLLETSMVLAGRTGDAEAWAARAEAALEAACERLAGLAMARDPAAFAPILAGSAGVGGVYGAWLRTRSLLGGRRHVAEHQAEGP